MILQSFDPIADSGARILILGSMPGAASLAAGQYYAHGRNAFWRIMGELYGAGPEHSYETRTAKLRENGVALWDVLKFCQREGSLDSNIRNEVPNDFSAFFAGHPGIRRLVLNGQKAGASFRKHASAACPPGVETVVVPSTSPAHALMSFARKCELWRAACLGPF